MRALVVPPLELIDKKCIAAYALPELGELAQGAEDGQGERLRALPIVELIASGPPLRDDPAPELSEKAVDAVGRLPAEPFLARCPELIPFQGNMSFTN